MFFSELSCKVPLHGVFFCILLEIKTPWWSGFFSIIQTHALCGPHISPKLPEYKSKPTFFFWLLHATSILLSVT